MKKVVVVFMTMVMVFLAISMNVSLAERFVDGKYGSEVEDYLEDWMKCQKIDEKYFENEVDEFGYYYGHGVMLINDFEEHYGVEWSEKSMEDILSKEYDGLELEIRTIGFYEGYNVYLMKAKATDPIGWYCESNGEEYFPDYEEETIYYYEGEMIYMVCNEP